MNDAKIRDFRIGQTVLDDHDELTIVPGLKNITSFYGGAYLNFKPVAMNADGTVTIKLSIGTDANAQAAQTVELAEITVNGLGLGSDAANIATEILRRIQTEIKFET